MSRNDKTFGEAFRDLLGEYVASSTGPGHVLHDISLDEEGMHLRLVASRDGVERDVTVPWSNRWIDDVESRPSSEPPHDAKAAGQALYVDALERRAAKADRLLAVAREVAASQSYRATLLGMHPSHDVIGSLATQERNDASRLAAAIDG